MQEFPLFAGRTIGQKNSREAVKKIQEFPEVLDSEELL